MDNKLLLIHLMQGQCFKNMITAMRVLKNKIIVTGIFLILWQIVLSQKDEQVQVLRLNSNNTSFPDSAREHGYTYDSIFYSVSEHYKDNSVLLIIPGHLNRKGKIDLIFWFHGWNNNIDTAMKFYEIEKQFIASKRNAILVMAETAKNAPDSYGGKLENPGVFKALVTDIMATLKKHGIVNQKSGPGNIVLAGHSGAFRIIAFILEKGNTTVEEVYLFDALYSQTDKFMSWIQQDKKHHFVNWYTNHGGGTDEMSIKMMHQLTDDSLSYTLLEEPSLNPTNVKATRVLFVHSMREHNVIINRPDNLKLLLENSFVLKPVLK
ncbi:MAG: hypothetical protein ACHQF0_15735 [Chitinophagales bacterium]